MKRNIEEANSNDIDRVSIEQQIIQTPRLEDIESHSTVVQIIISRIKL